MEEGRDGGKEGGRERESDAEKGIRKRGTQWKEYIGVQGGG